MEIGTCQYLPLLRRWWCAWLFINLPHASIVHRQPNFHVTISIGECICQESTEEWFMADATNARFVSFFIPATVLFFSQQQHQLQPTSSEETTEIDSDSVIASIVCSVYGTSQKCVATTPKIHIFIYRRQMPDNNINARLTCRPYDITMLCGTYSLAHSHTIHIHCTALEHIFAQNIMNRKKMEWKLAQLFSPRNVHVFANIHDSVVDALIGIPSVFVAFNSGVLASVRQSRFDRL